MQCCLTMQLPIIEHTAINNKLQTIWSLINQQPTPINHRGFVLVLEYKQNLPVKIRWQVNNKYYSIQVDHDKNEITIKYTDFADVILVFSNQPTESSHVNQRGKVKVTEWCTRPTHRSKRQIPTQALKKCNEFLGLIIDSLENLQSVAA